MTIKKDALAKGVRRLTSKGRKYIIIDLAMMYEEDPKLETVAKDFRMDPGEVYAALIFHKPNFGVRAAVFIEQTRRGLPGLRKAELDEFLRSELITIAFGFGKSASGVHTAVIDEPFLSWKFPRKGLLLVLPLQGEFSHVLEGSPEFLKREKRMVTAHKNFEQMRKRLDILKAVTESTAVHLNQLEELLKPFHESCAKIDVAQKLMALMGLEPKGGKSGLPEQQLQDRMKENKERLDKLARLTNKHMLYESPVPKIVEERKSVEVSAKQLELELELLVPLLKFYKDNLEFASEGLDRKISETLTEAYLQLIKTPVADKIMREHIAPLIDLICSMDPKLDMKGKISDRLFEQGLTTPATLPLTENAASVYTGMVLTAFPLTFGNVPGPFSFTVAVVAAAQGYIQKGLSDAASAKKLAGQLLRLTVIIGTFNQHRFDQIAAAVEANDFVKLRDFDWKKSFQSGPVLSYAVGIVYFLGLLKNIQEDDDLTLKRAADLLQPVLGAGLGVFQGLSHVGRLKQSLAPYQAGVQQGVTRLLSIAALVAASLHFLGELGADDTEGMIVAGLGGAGALLSLAGFLGFAGTVFGGSIVGVPVGAALQVLGAAIGIVTTILTAIRSATTPGVFLFIDGLLDELEARTARFGSSQFRVPNSKTHSTT